MIKYGNWDPKMVEKLASWRAYRHDNGSEEAPAEIEEPIGSRTGHLLHTVAESVDSEYPRHRYSLTKDQEQHGHAAGRVIVHQLENVDSSLQGAMSHFKLEHRFDMEDVERCHTCVTIGISRMNISTTQPKVNSLRCRRSFWGQLSTTPQTNDSTLQNSLSTPKIYHTKKLKKKFLLKFRFLCHVKSHDQNNDQLVISSCYKKKCYRHEHHRWN